MNFPIKSYVKRYASKKNNSEYNIKEEKEVLYNKSNDSLSDQFNFKQDPSYTPAFKQYHDGLFIKAEGNLIQTGTVKSNTTSIDCQAGAKLISTGKIESGVFSFNHNAIKDQQGENKGTLHSSGWMNIDIEKDFANHGQILTQNLMLKALSFDNTQSIKWGNQAIIETQEQSKNLGKMEGEAAIWRAENFENFGFILAKDLVFDIQGKWKNAQTIETQGNISIRASELEQQGNLDSENALMIVDKSANLQGITNLSGSLDLQAKDLSHSGQTKGENISCYIKDEFSNAGPLEAEKGLAISADKLNNSSILKGEEVSLNTSEFNNQKSGVISATNAVLKTKTLDNSGNLNIAQNGSIQGNSLYNSGTIDATNFSIEASNIFYNSGNFNIMDSLLIDAFYNINAGYISAKDALLKGTLVSNLWSLTASNSVSVESIFYLNAGFTSARHISVDSLVALNTGLMAGENISMRGLLVANAGGLLGRNVSMKGILVGNFGFALGQNVSMTGVGCMNTGLMGGMNCSMTGLEVDNYGIMAGKNVLLEQFTYEGLARAAAQEMGITPTTLFQKGWETIMGNDWNSSESSFGNVSDYFAAGLSLYNGDYIGCVSKMTGIRYEDLQLLDAVGEYFGYFGIPSQIEAAKNSKIALDVFSYLETAYSNFEQYTLSSEISQLSKKWEELNQLLNNRMGWKVKQAGYVYGQNIVGRGQNIEHSGSTTGSSHVQYIADKDLSLTGTINGNANVQGGESLNIHDLQGEGSLEGTAPTVVLSGEITRSNPTDFLHLHAKNLSNTSNIKAGDIQLNVEENLDNSGSLGSESILAISADTLNNSNKLEGKIVSLKTRELNNEKSGIITGRKSPNASESSENAVVQIQAEVARNDGTITTEQAVLEIKSFDNSGHLNILNNGSFQGNSLVNTGTTKASNFSIESSQRFYNTGSLDVPGNLVIDAGYNTNFGDITAKNAHLEGVVVSNSGEIKTTNSLGIKGEVVRNFGSVNGGENLEIIATQHYEDSEHSLNSAGKTNILIAPNNQGFNGHLTGGEVVVDLKDMPLRALLNQIEAPVIKANLQEGNIVLEDDLIIKNSLHLCANRFENKAKLTANKDFMLHSQTDIINDGPINIHGNGFLESGQTFANFDTIEASDLHVKGQHILLERQIQRRAIRGGYADTLQKEVAMRASSGNLKVEATDSLYGRGAQFEATGNVTLSSQGSLYLGAQQTALEITHSGRDSYYHRYTLRNHKTQVTAGQKTDILSGKAMALEGTDVNSGGDISVKSVASLEIKPVYDITQAEQSVTSRSGFFRKKKTRSSQQSTQTVVRDTFKSDGNILLQCQANVHIQASEIGSKGSTEIRSLQDKVYLESAKSSHMVSIQKQSKSLVWQSQEQKGNYDEKVELPHIRAQGGVTISGARGVDVDYVGNLDILENDPNTAWIKVLRKDPQATWHQIMEEHKKWNQKVQGLTGPAAALIALAIGITTQGVGTGLISSLTTNGTIGTMASAGFTSMVSQASISLINNQGNLSKTFKELSSSQQIRSFPTSVISAGLTQGLSKQLNLSTRATTFTQHLQKNVVTSGTSAGLSILIHKQDVKDALLQAAKSIGAGTLGGVMANNISTAYSAGDLDWVTHKLVHGALGAFTGAILGDDPRAGALAGALGGIASEVIADTMLKGATEKALEKALEKAASEGRPLAYKDVLQAFETEANKVANIGRMGAALAAFSLNQDVSIATSIATNAVDNNFVPFVMVGLSVASGLYSGYEVYSAYKKGGAKGALEELAKQGVINLAGGAIAKLSTKAASATLKAVLDKNPMLSMVFGKANKKIDLLGTKKSHTLPKEKLISNDVLTAPKTGSGLKNDLVKPIINNEGKMIQEFPMTAKSHGFPDIIDNYAGQASKFDLERGAKLYQLEGSYNGKVGRFEWIIQDSKVTHRMFIENGKINGKSIQK
ncbi:MAG: DUF637 domain-containing protein [Alphaproteobacteria bacterium]|nr:DUF637 domain-containing protein [Alphaproteobacteria bacterium]